MQITGIEELDTRIGKARAAMQALHYSVVQARSQKFAMGVWGRSPHLPEAGGLGAKPPVLENFVFFCKNNFILGLF